MHPSEPIPINSKYIPEWATSLLSSWPSTSLKAAFVPPYPSFFWSNDVVSLLLEGRVIAFVVRCSESVCALFWRNYNSGNYDVNAIDPWSKIRWDQILWSWNCMFAQGRNKGERNLPQARKRKYWIISNALESRIQDSFNQDQPTQCSDIVSRLNALSLKTPCAPII